MSFNSLDFILLIFITAILYYALPHKLRNPLLLVSSYVFYAAFDLGLTSYIVLCTLLTYVTAILVEKNRGTAKAKTWAAVGVVANLLPLAFFKYYNFAVKTFLGMLKLSESRIDSFTLKLLVPLGISFIVFSVVSYIIDVYRGKLSAERNLFKLALYISFFPKVVQGPIERAGDIIPQFDEVHKFDDEGFRKGLLLILYGLFMKMVVADRAAVIVDTIYGSMSAYSGAAVAFATAMFAIQIYCDFAGYSYTAIGAAKILGFDFKANFRQPYMSLTVGEFWRRWHISLNNWLRDYLYIPLGGNRCSPARKNFNILVVFAVSGLWHGADWGYVIWGVINAVYIMIEGVFKARRKKKGKTLIIESEEQSAKRVILRTLKRLWNFILITFTWLFFRAQTLPTAAYAGARIIKHFDFNGFIHYCGHRMLKGAGTTLYGLDVIWGMTLLFACIVIVVVIDMLAYRYDLTDRLSKCNFIIRWAVYLILIFAIILFGVYGYGYSASAFIYAAF